MSLSDIRFSKEEWEAYLPCLRTYNDSTKQYAFMVLVEGRSVVDVAREVGVSKQTVHIAVKRVIKRLEYNNAPLLVPVLLWMPADEVERLQNIAFAMGGKPDKQ